MICIWGTGECNLDTAFMIGNVFLVVVLFASSCDLCMLSLYGSISLSGMFCLATLAVYCFGFLSFREQLVAIF